MVTNEQGGVRKEKNRQKKFKESTILPFKNIGVVKIDGKWIPRVLSFVNIFKRISST